MASVAFGALVALALAGVLLSVRPRAPSTRQRPDAARVFAAAACSVVAAPVRARAERRAAEAFAANLPETVELIGVAAAAGCNVRLALEAVRRAGEGPASRALGAALVEADIGGVRLADALMDLPADHGEQLRGVCALLADAERYGTALAPALERLGDDLRTRRRRRAEERARRLPVRLLLPLVLCVLPAFALLTVAPLLVSGVRALTTDSATYPEAHP